MNILLINNDKAKLYPLMFQEYLESRGARCYSSTWRQEEIEAVIASQGLKPSDTIIHARTAGPHVTGNYQDLEKAGYLVINKSSATALTSNKYESQVFARQNGIPTADTYKLNKRAVPEIKSLVEKYNCVVAKPILSQGQGVYCRKLDAGMPADVIAGFIADIPGEEIIIQALVDYQKLIRTIVIGSKLLKGASTFDVPASGGWKASVCLNPDIKKYGVEDDRLIELAEKTARVFDCGVSFIDFFAGSDGNLILNELNTACSLIIHEKATGLPIHRFIADYLLSLS
jgi:glutathione synthase/RimK-type ligase-like ATP-grasp enzyme